MKPGNLLVQGAKSDGKRKMRIRYYAHRIFGVHFFYNGLSSQRSFPAASGSFRPAPPITASKYTKYSFGFDGLT